MIVSSVIFAVLLYKTNSQFICTDGTEISKDKICDGVDDCSDAPDEFEKLCMHIQCKQDHFRCRYGGCIRKSLRCDGKSDCKDGSDELTCKEPFCNHNEFQCLNNKCIPLNSTCNNHNDCADNSDEDFVVCEHPSCDSEKFKCRSGGCIDKSTVCDGFLDCSDGSDEEKNLCDSISVKDKFKCPAILSHNLDVTCHSPTRGQQSCEAEQEIGTIANAICKEHYEAFKEPHHSKSHCQFDGKWNSEHVKCKPVCGINEHIQPLIANGYPIGNWPWYTGLYSSQTGELKFFCGATLISEHVVVTAAHCVWKKSSKEIQAVFAKYISDLSEYEENTQKRNVSKIIIHPNYYDIETNYGSDIAVLFLDSPLILTQFVRPACLDWSSVVIPEISQRIGMVAGMGVTENDTYAYSLRSTEIPIVSTEECIKNQRRDFHKYITYTSFCAGWMNGTGVCNGDSGGGLLVQEKDRWYLHGIVSISPRKKGMAVCDTKRFTIFTKVSMYLNWIKEVVPPQML